MENKKFKKQGRLARDQKTVTRNYQRSEKTTDAYSCDHVGDQRPENGLCHYKKENADLGPNLVP
jgi:hypothetical protein